MFSSSIKHFIFQRLSYIHSCIKDPFQPEFGIKCEEKSLNNHVTRVSPDLI